MSKNKRYIKGLFKDTTYLDQPEGTWRYALNAIVQDKDGTISNETGNTPDGYIKGVTAAEAENMLCIGHIEVDDNKVILFLKDRRPDAATLYESGIAVWSNGVFTWLYKPVPTDHNLNFNKEYPIEGTFKIDSSEDLVVYFTDDLNPPRAFNVTRQERSFSSGGNLTKLYAITTTLGPFGAGVSTNPNRTHSKHIELLNLFPNTGPIPHIDLDYVGTIQSAVITGGGLRTGVYYLALAYVDDDNVATNYVTVSNPVSIVDEYDFTSPAFRKDGAKDGSQTSKSVRWKVSNINNDYSLIRPSIIRKMGGVTEAHRLPDIDAQVAAINGITYSGLEGAASSAIEDVIIDTVAYDTAKTINQLDGILYLGNLTRTSDVGYQKYANNIKLNSVVKSMNPFDSFYATVDNLETGFGTMPPDLGNDVDPSKSYRWAPNIFKYKGYMRDEVYAFYIAFILNDGSMSYAYHIPGRESLNNELDSPSGAGIRSDLANISSYAANFHFFDSSIASITSTQMNYWHNATEFYPNTENFQTWDKDGNVPGSNLQGLNVRHHHFPSNENSARKTIAANICSTLNSLGTIQASQAWNGRLMVYHNDYANNGGEVMENNWNRGFRMQNLWTGAGKSLVYDATGAIVTNDCAIALLTNSGISTGSASNSGNMLVADQPMQVRCTYLIGGKKYNNTTADVKIRRDDANGNISWSVQNSVSSWGGIGCGSLPVDYFSSRNACGGTCDNGSNAAMAMGATVTVRGYTQTTNGGGPKWRQAEVGEFATCNNPVQDLSSPGGFHGASGASGTPYQWIQFNIIAGTILTATLTDAIVEHDISVLGFELEDIQIPRNIADKVQGFRIYYAKRKHADKRILGQDYIKPMGHRKEIVGLCSEVDPTNADKAGQILGTLQDVKEIFYSKQPWPDVTADLPTATVESITAFNALVTKPAYNIFSTHDFNLLRTKNSIAGWTHIKPEYVVENFVWNGPTTNQDKKMYTNLINFGSTTNPVEVSEQWGYNTALNCYPKEVLTGIFIGSRYNNMSFHAGQTGAVPGINPRMLGQKAKTYLHGDSIFDGTPLGFGGKIFNEFGETAIIFSLMTGHYLEALPNLQDAGTGNIQDNWGEYHLQAPSILLKPFPNNATSGTAAYSSTIRNSSYLVNYHAFKTDMYKSIDSQELVWTGFEVLGDDIEIFTFDDGIMNGSGSTKDIRSEGIFGGDTFISRYGVPMGLKPSNPTELSRPLRAIYGNIVESPDNINFRHSESNKSSYFPGTAAREILKYVGTSSGTEASEGGANEGDYTAQDNMKYNPDYSSANDIRPAIPLPLKDSTLSEFTTRTHRSAKADTTSLIDNYRTFLANQFKDLPKNRGELWKLSSFNNLLYFHMVDSLFAAKGKQTMSMGDGSEAAVGSGDIFKQDPDELVQTQDGYGGTQSQWAALTTRAGYFFVDRVRGKVFLMQDKLTEISNVGMETWFRENLGSALDGLGAINTGACPVIDNPIIGLGLTAVYDPKYKRIILTKRDLEPTQAFMTGWNQLNTIPMNPGTIRFNNNECKYRIFFPGLALPPPAPSTPGTWTNIEWDNEYYFKKTGWTISYFPELAVWSSFHDYIPYKYFNTTETFYSFTDLYTAYLDGTISTGGVVSVGGADDPFTNWGNRGIWKHNEGEKGVLYQEQPNPDRNYYNFEFEAIHTETKDSNAIFHNFSFMADVYDQVGNLILDAGFTSFYVFNTFQISGDKTSSLLEYLVNIRRIGNQWNVNRFRDLAALAVDASAYYTPGNPNVVGGISTGTLTTSSTVPMFTIVGMVETPTAAYSILPPAVKPFQLRKKFIDKWIGIRLIYNNISNNLINLHSTAIGAKKLYR
tara:strand:+ start:5578 stop:11094 length:5517 start_codon:yes stop_codon:yes gene_type:complete